MKGIYSALIPESETATRDAISRTLAKFGVGMLKFAVDSGVSILPLKTGELYSDKSPELRRLGIDVDKWPLPPAGLFVVAERRVYLRSLSPMTTAHEFGHAIDCALGGGVYWSGTNAAVRRCFSNATLFVTPYAATGLDEYAAECIRSFAGGGINDPASPWPKATRARLRKLDPAMYELVHGVFAGFRARGDT